MSNNSVFSLQDLGGLGLIGLAIYGGIKLWKLNDISKKVDLTIRDMTDKTPVDINKALVDKAITNAVDREVRTAVGEVSKVVANQVRADLNKEIRTDVKAHYDEMKAEVSKKISDQVAKIDETALRKEVSERAEEKVLDKLEGSTDEALAKFNRGLGNITKIYEGISNVMSGTKGNGNGLRLSFD